MARIVNERHMERLQKHSGAGCEIICSVEEQRILLQRYVEPTILDVGRLENSAGSAAMQEELFGPILPVLSYHRARRCEFVL
ncbi:MAG: aldehyde dehydrogenase family protein [Mediterraneibacter gnavus]